MDTLVLLGGSRLECTETRPPLYCQLGKDAGEAELFNRRFVLSLSIRKRLPVADAEPDAHSQRSGDFSGGSGRRIFHRLFTEGCFIFILLFVPFLQNKRNSAQTGKTFNSQSKQLLYLWSTPLILMFNFTHAINHRVSLILG